MSFWNWALGGHYGDPGGGILDQGGDLFGGQGGIDGHIGSAEHQSGEVDDGPFPAIFRKDCDAVAFENAPGAESVRQSVDAGEEFVTG